MEHVGLLSRLLHRRPLAVSNVIIQPSLSLEMCLFLNVFLRLRLQTPWTANLSSQRREDCRRRKAKRRRNWRRRDNLLVLCGNKWSPSQQVGCGIIMITIEMKKRKKPNHKVADDRMPKRVSSSENNNKSKTGRGKKRARSKCWKIRDLSENTN